MAQKYKVLAGIHIQDGVQYRKGETFVSERSLEKSFPGKFAPVGAAAAPEDLEEEESETPVKPQGKGKAVKGKGTKESFE